jgi:hypothetical protein
MFWDKGQGTSGMWSYIGWDMILRKFMSHIPGNDVLRIACPMSQSKVV